MFNQFVQIKDVTVGFELDRTNYLDFGAQLKILIIFKDYHAFLNFVKKIFSKLVWESRENFGRFQMASIILKCTQGYVSKFAAKLTNCLGQDVSFSFYSSNSPILAFKILQYS